MNDETSTEIPIKAILDLYLNFIPHDGAAGPRSDPCSTFLANCRTRDCLLNLFKASRHQGNNAHSLLQGSLQFCRKAATKSWRPLSGRVDCTSDFVEINHILCDDAIEQHTTQTTYSQLLKMKYIFSEEEIAVPENVTVKIRSRIVTVEGPRGAHTHT